MIKGNNCYIFVPNDPRIKNNSIFDATIDPNFSIFSTLKNYFDSHGVELQTVDLGNLTQNDLIICFDVPHPWNTTAWNIIRQTQAKKILIIFEPPVVNPFNYLNSFRNNFDLILTWDDDTVNNKNILKYHWPQSNKNLNYKAISFKSKKLLSLMNGNKLPFFLFGPLVRKGKELYSERIKVIEWFEKNHPEEFDLYGVGWNQKKKYNLTELLFGSKIYNTYRGKVDDKIQTISQYKFSICFENMSNINGYMTEKIFDCLKARTVPIYWGAANIGKYIDTKCFIDYRNFKSLDELYLCITEMGEKEYQKYIDCIENQLKNEKFLSTWFEQGFAKYLFEIIKTK
mgnify:CR=1 FL=1